MYDYLRGELASKSPTSSVIDVGGVGYVVETSLRTSQRLPSDKATVRVLVHHRIQDDRARLFGFADEAERALFRRLIAVAGIGPGHALALLSGAEPEAIWGHIGAGEWKLLAQTKGIGPKIAQRACNELGEEAKRQVLITGPAPVAEAVAREDAIAALVVLGYSEAQAAKAVSSAAQRTGVDAPLDRLVREALAQA
jgi:Holliday junction DNA helicase RuvA